MMSAATSKPPPATEVVKGEPGQEAVLDRLLDLLLISVSSSGFATTARSRTVIAAPPS